MVVSIDYKFECCICVCICDMWNVSVIFVSICALIEWSGENVALRLIYNKQNGYVIVTNVQFIEMTKVNFFLCSFLSIHCLMRQAYSIYLKLRRHIFLFFVSIVFNSYFISSLRVLRRHRSCHHHIDAASFRLHSFIPIE